MCVSVIVLVVVVVVGVGVGAGVGIALSSGKKDKGAVRDLQGLCNHMAPVRSTAIMWAYTNLWQAPSPACHVHSK